MDETFDEHIKKISLGSNIYGLLRYKVIEPMEYTKIFDTPNRNPPPRPARIPLLPVIRSPINLKKDVRRF